MKRKFEMQWIGDGCGWARLRLLYIAGSFEDRLTKTVDLTGWQWIPQKVTK